MRRKPISIHVSIRDTSVQLLKVDFAIERKTALLLYQHLKYFYFLRDAMVFTP
jgi:hypothetical protein